MTTSFTPGRNCRTPKHCKDSGQCCAAYDKWQAINAASNVLSLPDADLSTLEQHFDTLSQLQNASGCLHPDHLDAIGKTTDTLRELGSQLLPPSSSYNLNI